MKLYYERLIGRIHKVIYIYENDKNDFLKYIRSLYLELLANDKFESVFQIGYKIKGLEQSDISHSDVRKTMLECRGVVINLVENWGEKDDC